ncbi:hypothetical protein [Qipengyuania sp. JC766]|uniref:hypothetical protein n=1 Tax=Qipengyuania sp. JC766 TaxID=3232139 RepID=UPI00345AD376
MTDTIEATGVQRLRTRRQKFWRWCALAFALSIFAGMASGTLAALYQDDLVPAWSLYALWAVVAFAWVWFSRDYFLRIDELDQMDNLWACLIGFYFYVGAFVTWYMFADAGLAPEIDGTIMFFATMTVMVVSYGLRKLGLR